MARTEKEQLFKLTACRRCLYCLCICVALKHAETCPHRRYVLAQSPVDAPCDCGRAELDAKWRTAEFAKYEAARAAEGSKAA